MTTINFENALGIHQQAMTLRMHRSAVLANNLANADTPGYLARDFNFRKVLSGERAANTKLSLNTTRAGHLHPGVNAHPAVELGYRMPLQPSIDGNTVDEQLESAAFARNAVEFGASFRFLNGKFRSLKKAISGD